MRVLAPEATRPIVKKDGQMHEPFRRFTLQMSRESLIIGSGSPEGAVDAKRGRRYMDEDGTTGTILYIKKLDQIGGDNSQGWILV